MSYHLEGRLLEACTCGDYCPCRVEGEPDGSDCEAMNAWHIEKGTINGADVSGLTLVALRHVHGHVLQRQGVVYCVDDKATGEQEAALLDAWSGKEGGPLADMSALIGEVSGVERLPMTFTVQKGKGRLKVGQAVTADLARPSPGEHGMAMPHAERDICATQPGEETHSARASAYRVALPNYGFAVDLHDYPVLEGRFRFEG